MPIESHPLPSLLAALKSIPPLSFCGEKVPLENRAVREALEKELLLMLWNRPQVILYLKRANRYLPSIEADLRRHALPDDLKYIPIVESALLFHAGSYKGAVGYWQFLKETGRNYGLAIQPEIDERRNLAAATEAACKYFEDLHTLFGSWTLAAAAFNMGENGLEAEIELQAVKDYYRLYLPNETQRYIFRILAAKLILTRPESFGFKLSDADLYPPIAAENVNLTIEAPVPILLVARAARTDFKTIKGLNPELKGYELPSGTIQLRVPVGAGQEFNTRFDTAVRSFNADESSTIHVVQAGENLTMIAKRYNVALAALLVWNHLTFNSTIHPGDRLRIQIKLSP